MWLIVLMCLLMIPVTFAALVYLLVVVWRVLDGLLQGTLGALRLVWRLTLWTGRAGVRALHFGCSGLSRLRDWHASGSTWAGQYLLASWLAWSNTMRRRYVAGQLRRLRRLRAHK